MELQWGRDQLVAEMQIDDLEVRFERIASMGPRPIGRGNRANSPIVLREYSGFNGAATNWSRKSC